MIWGENPRLYIKLIFVLTAESIYDVLYFVHRVHRTLPVPAFFRLEIKVKGDGRIIYSM